MLLNLTTQKPQRSSTQEIAMGDTYWMNAPFSFLLNTLRSFSSSPSCCWSVISTIWRKYSFARLDWLITPSLVLPPLPATFVQSSLWALCSSFLPSCHLTLLCKKLFSPSTSNLDKFKLVLLPSPLAEVSEVKGGEKPREDKSFFSTS